MTTEIPTPSIDYVILEALQQSDKNRGQLFNLTGKSYLLLVRSLQWLKDQNHIELILFP